MNDNMRDTSDKLIKSEIKTRQVTYYLTTEEDLRHVKSNSLMGDVFSGLASLTAGGIISVILTRATGLQLERETSDVLNVLLYVFVIATVIFVLFAIYFHYQSFVAIKNIEGSGTVKSLRSGNQEEIIQTDDKKIVSEESPLEILKAEYWTQKKRLDVTEELRKKITTNKLEVIASNDIKGDPEFGTGKKLTVEYRFDGITVTKEFTEGEKIVIP